MNNRILVAVAASAAVHAAVLVWMVPRLLEGGQSRSTASRGAGQLLGRLLAEPLASTPIPPAPAANLGPSPVPRPAFVPPAAAQVTAAVPVAPIPSAAQQVFPAAPARPAASGTSAADAALDRFRPATELTSRPVAISTGDLEPDWIREIREPAMAKVSVYVDADGAVRHVELREASNPRIGEMVRKAFEEARFRPGRLQGERVEARVDISIRYDAERDRVTDPNADRAPVNVLAPGQVRQAPSIGPDKPSTGGIRNK